MHTTDEMSWCGFECLQMSCSVTWRRKMLSLLLKVKPPPTVDCIRKPPLCYQFVMNNAIR